MIRPSLHLNILSTCRRMDVLRIFGSHLIAYWTVGGACSLARPTVPPLSTRDIAAKVLSTQVLLVLPCMLAYAVLLGPVQGVVVGIPNVLWAFKLWLFREVQERAYSFLHDQLLHSDWGYRSFHGEHHALLIPNGMCALYGHWVDVLVSFLIPLALGPLLFGASRWLWELWTIVATIERVLAHAPDVSRHHPLHHARLFGLKSS